MRTARLKWIPIECDDNEFDDLETEGFFHRLVKLLGRCSGQIPADLTKVAKALRLDIRKFHRLWAKVKDLFIVTGGWIRHRIVDDALARFRVRISDRDRPEVRDKPIRKPLKTNGPPADIVQPIEPEEGSIGSAPRATPSVSPPAFSHDDRKKERPRRHRGRPTACRMTPVADWVATPADVDFALERGHTHEWIARQTQEFCDYHSARGNRFADWSAAWRRWVRFDEKFKLGHGRETLDQRTARRTPERRAMLVGIFRDREAARRGAAA